MATLREARELASELLAQSSTFRNDVLTLAEKHDADVDCQISEWISEDDAASESSDFTIGIMAGLLGMTMQDIVSDLGWNVVDLDFEYAYTNGVNEAGGVDVTYSVYLTRVREEDEASADSSS